MLISPVSLVVTERTRNVVSDRWALYSSDDPKIDVWDELFALALEGGADGSDAPDLLVKLDRGACKLTKRTYVTPHGHLQLLWVETDGRRYSFLSAPWAVAEGGTRQLVLIFWKGEVEPTTKTLGEAAARLAEHLARSRRVGN